MILDNVGLEIKVGSIITWTSSRYGDMIGQVIRINHHLDGTFTITAKGSLKRNIRGDWYTWLSFFYNTRNIQVI